MARFNVDITDPAALAGIKAAREQHNAGLTPARDDGHPDYLGTDQAYVQHVMGRAAESYAKAFGFHEETLAAEEAAVAAKRARVEQQR